MKTVCIFALIACLVIALALTACGKSKTQSELSDTVVVNSKSEISNSATINANSAVSNENARNSKHDNFLPFKLKFSDTYDEFARNVKVQKKQPN